MLMSVLQMPRQTAHGAPVRGDAPIHGLAENRRAYNARVDDSPQKGYNLDKTLLHLELADGRSGRTKDAAVGRAGKKG
jgi:hypothetical protein